MGSSKQLAVQTEGLKRAFGELEAVKGIDLAVPRGSFYGFLGPNGAGKSTTMKCLTGLLRPTGGEIRILDLDWSRAEEIRQRIGVVPEELALFERLTGLESLIFVGRIFGLSEQTIEDRASQLLNLMDLGPSAGVVASDYSHGMRKKLALACALIAGPELLLLDEPFEGIDALASRQIKRVLSRFVAGGGTIFLTSHVLEIVETLCDHIGIIHQGRLVVQGPLKDLKEKSDRTLEEVFIQEVGGTQEERSLSWLGSPETTEAAD